MATSDEGDCLAVTDSSSCQDGDHAAVKPPRRNLQLPIPARTQINVAPRLLGCPQNVPSDAKSGVVKEKCENSQVLTFAKDHTQQVDLARQISMFSLIASLLVGSLAITLGCAEGALSLVGFGGELLLDGVSSAFVLWRFKRPKLTHTTEDASDLNRRLARDSKRERNSSIGIGVTFLLLACLLSASALWKYLWWDGNDSDKQREEHVAAVYSSFLVWISAVVFGCLAVMKFKLAEALQSQVLRKDALCSLLGVVLAIIVGVTDMVVLAAENDPASLAMVDPIAGATIAVILGAEGCRTLWHNRHGGGHQDEPKPFL